MGQWDPSPRSAEMRSQLQSFTKALRRDFRPGVALGALRNVPPPGRRMAPSLEVAHPLGYRPLGAGGLPPLAPPAVNASRLVPCFRSVSTVPFCLLDPWPPKLAANRSEAPLAFRMKSADFLNSSGHSCIRSGLCAFPMQRVKFVFEGWGRVELENIFRSCTLTPNSGGTLSSSVLHSSIFLTSLARNQLLGADTLISGRRRAARFLTWVGEPQNLGERSLGSPKAL